MELTAEEIADSYVCENVTYVLPMDCFSLLLVFGESEFRIFEMSVLSHHSSGLAYDILQDNILFKTVQLDGTGTICWSNGFDLAVEFLYANSEFLIIL